MTFIQRLECFYVLKIKTYFKENRHIVETFLITLYFNLFLFSIIEVLTKCCKMLEIFILFLIIIISSSFSPDEAECKKSGKATTD